MLTQRRGAEQNHQTIRAAILLACLLSTPALAQQRSLTADPDLGSRIRNEAVTWSMPLKCRNADLSEKQMRVVRGSYESMPKDDEPPYPVNGMIDIARAFSRV